VVYVAYEDEIEAFADSIMPDFEEVEENAEEE